MAQKAPGKHYRKGISLIEITRLFPDDATAETWFIETRWPDRYVPGVRLQERAHGQDPQAAALPVPGLPRALQRQAGTLMHGSKLGLQVWAVAYYLLATGLKGTASMKLHRDLGVTQKTAWHLAHRIRETCAGQQTAPFNGPVEVDETYVGGRASHAPQAEPCRGPVGKVAVLASRTGPQTASAPPSRPRPVTRSSHSSPPASSRRPESTRTKRWPTAGWNHQTVHHRVSQYVNRSSRTAWRASGR